MITCTGAARTLDADLDIPYRPHDGLAE